ncbi:PREDICTED: myelin protein zero-like protein 1 [Nanorana parkeri]|uniref:myelin protein zero-like protein 1 n=1 Tax=Nanorana parkeri TaxID=125878 RepID=UPI000854A080|nr:PREDICTED: myelin protein zero-like protein 1 [Nanorana parkeri]
MWSCRAEVEMAAVMRVCRCGRKMLWPLLLAVLCVVNRSSSVEVYTPEELTVENGTQAKLSCTFKSSSAIHSETIVFWSYKEEGRASAAVKIFGYMGGKPIPWGDRFKDRTTWAGDLNKKDASIKIANVTFKDNGTYTCEVINPQDLGGGPKELKLRVVEKGNLPSSNVPFLVGIICAAIGGLLLIAIIVFAIVITKKKRSRKNYTGCSTTESLMSPVKQPPRKSPSDTEALVTNAPTGTVQGPVIYAQLDHSGTANSQVNKSERVVYADIRKVC